MEGRPSKVSYRDGQEGWVVTQTIAFLRQCQEKQQPFFVHVSLPKPHQCFTPAQEFWDLYDPDKLTLPPSCDGDLKLKAPHMVKEAKRWRQGEWTLFEPRTFAAGRLRKLHGYLGNISHVDFAVGELLEALRETGLEANTLVVYSSDHGEYACENDIMGKAPGICGDAVTRVPMLWRWPGRLPAGHQVKEVVETVDVAPTLCALAGLEPLQTADGLDLSAMLQGGRGDPQRVGVTEFAWSRSIRQGPWRLVMYPTVMFAEEYPEGFGELYNLEEDPWEMHNRYFEPRQAELVHRLERAWMDWRVTRTRPAIIHGSTALEPPPGPQARTEYQHTVNADGKMHWRRVEKAALTSWFKIYQ
jgi:choline-sulfatase/uncharacterized sulfatase